MSKSVQLNRTDTAVSGVTSLALPVAVLNWKADWRVKENEPSEVILTNLSSPVDRPERFRVGMSDIKDIYRNSGIDATLFAPSRRGVSVLCQLVDTWSITDDSDSSYEVALPVEAHVVLKLPANELITADMIKAFLGRMCSGLFETGSIASDRIKAIVRGSLLPTDL